MATPRQENPDGLGAYYDRAKLIRHTMKKYGCNRERAAKAVDEVLRAFNKKEPNMTKKLNDALAEK